MQQKSHEVSFTHNSHPALKLTEGSNLSEHLTVTNSPVLFGCRTGICGTCLVEVVEQGNGEIPPPSDDEKEVLELYAQGHPKARLACQLDLRADVRLCYLGFL
jgi:ferredoxin